jgi:hypothetical protein
MHKYIVFINKTYNHAMVYVVVSNFFHFVNKKPFQKVYRADAGAQLLPSYFSVLHIPHSVR